jgi:hypothetical protein
MAHQPSEGTAALWVAGDGKSRAARTAEILLTLSRFGFGELVDRQRGSRWLPGGRAPAPEAAPGQAGAIRLRQVLEALGPSFVKIGQLLAMHAGALPLLPRGRRRPPPAGPGHHRRHGRPACV